MSNVHKIKLLKFKLKKKLLRKKKTEFNLKFSIDFLCLNKDANWLHMLVT